MKSPVLLLYNLSGEKASKIAFAAMRNGVRLRPVSPSEYGCSLGFLCGLETAAQSDQPDEALTPNAPTAPFRDEMLVMAFFSDAQISAFLGTLRRLKAPSVALKAILTDTNQAWDSLELNRQLSMERDALACAGKPLHQAAKA